MSRSLSRRRLIKTGIVAAAATSPGLIRRSALASSGTVRILLWSDSLPDALFRAFAEKTGVDVRITRIDSNDKMLELMKNAAAGSYDICSPSAARAYDWMDSGLLAPWDFTRLDNLANVYPALLQPSTGDWSDEKAEPYWLPTLWGTEAIAWQTDAVALEPGNVEDFSINTSPPTGALGLTAKAAEASLGGIVSYGQLWNEIYKNKAMARPRSALVGAALYLEQTGQMAPGSLQSSYESLEQMRPVWDQITSWCIERKDQFKRFWSNEQEQISAMRSGEVVIAQAWEKPIRALQSSGAPIAYQAPVEGALTWVDGFSRTRAAQNLDAVYELMQFCLNPEPAGQAIDYHGFNSAVAGAQDFANPDYKEYFELAYPGEALDRLRPWPSEPQWFSVARVAYRNRFINA